MYLIVFSFQYDDNSMLSTWCTNVKQVCEYNVKLSESDCHKANFSNMRNYIRYVCKSLQIHFNCEIYWKARTHSVIKMRDYLYA